MYAIICFDRPDSASLRDKHRAAHVKFLDANAARIAFGGPLKSIAEGPSTGALIVVNCATREEAEAFIGADPFRVGGVYESVSIRAFKQVFPASRP
ncbi:MAG TPA: YciI family protein [Burkholderiales bacterium]|nr:YciI family protein [Burkholderiales bacterium]